MNNQERLINTREDLGRLSSKGLTALAHAVLKDAREAIEKHQEEQDGEALKVWFQVVEQRGNI